jgi:hypothetical protein
MSIVLTNEEAGFSEEQIAKIKTASDYKDKGDAAFKASEAKAGMCTRRIGRNLQINSHEPV